MVPNGYSATAHGMYVGYASSPMNDDYDVDQLPLEHQPGLRVWGNFGQREIFFAKGNYSHAGLCNAWVAGVREVEFDEELGEGDEETAIDVYRWMDTGTAPFRR